MFEWYLTRKTEIFMRRTNPIANLPTANQIWTARGLNSYLLCCCPGAVHRGFPSRIIYPFPLSLFNPLIILLLFACNLRVRLTLWGRNCILLIKWPSSYRAINILCFGYKNRNLMLYRSVFLKLCETAAR
jgi:hypothetical protein